ncbi:Rap1a/Tai family immunity protein [Maricaulis maris]|uniref:Rap1a/Tai family immunity protein n=1 Tax=Maricaulis maris TaxID=74318 RepID=UPI0026EECCA0|nr:Rap1a/Tai family immunity protein [Maricaulis maris]
MKRSVAALVALFWAGDAHAQETTQGTVRALYEGCQDVSDGEFICSFYILGYVEGWAAFRDLMNATYGTDLTIEGNACAPSTVTPAQQWRVFMRWAEANPQNEHLPAGAGLMLAFSEAWPCDLPAAD